MTSEDTKPTIVAVDGPAGSGKAVFVSKFVRD